MRQVTQSDKSMQIEAPIPDLSRSVLLRQPSLSVFQFQFRQAIDSDLAPIALRGGGAPELAFQNWEDVGLLRKIIEREPAAIQVAYDGQRLAGFIIGGSFGVRATVSHLWVDPAYQGAGIGRELWKQIQGYFESLGVRRVHLMTTEGNDKALEFWRKRGFEERRGESFLELDL